MGIQEWLSSDQDFETGRQLYERHGGSNVLKRLFAQGPTVYNCGKLADALSALVPPPIKVPKPVVPAPLVKPIEEKNQPPATEQVLAQLRPLISARSYAHAQLAIAETQEKRKELAFEIVDLADTITPLWDLYDYAKEHGHLPEPPKAEPITRDRFQLGKHLANLKSQRSKLKKKPERLLDLQEVMRQIKTIEEALNHG